MTASRDPNSDMSDLKRNLSECNTFYSEVGSINPRNPGLHNDLIQFAKKLMRRALSWYLRPLQQFQAAVTRTLNDLGKAIENYDLAWRQNIPAFLNAVSTVNAFGHELGKLRRELEQGLRSVRQGQPSSSEQAILSARQEMEQELKSMRTSITATWERIEFTRREILFEMKYGRQISGESAINAESNPVEQKIISLEKIASARQLGLKLNLGCGHLPLVGYVNVDRRELPELRLEEGSVAEIFSAHLLEHFTQEMLRRRLLPKWRSLLMPGGMFRAVVPDGEAMLAGVAAGNYSFSNFREVLFGAQDYDGDFHFNLFTPDSLCELLEEAGFVEIRVNERARPNGKCFELEVSATNPRLNEMTSKLSSARTINIG
jgi:hypothetical protein